MRLKFFNTNIIRSRAVFAVTKGKYVGDFYVVYDIEENDISFIVLPDFNLVRLDKDSVDIALKNGILDRIKILPQNIFDHIVTEFLGRQKLNDSTH